MKILMVFELPVDSEREARELIDRFREAALPGPCHGITISRATCGDVRASGLLKQVPGIGPVPEAFIRPW